MAPIECIRNAAGIISQRMLHFRCGYVEREPHRADIPRSSSHRRYGSISQVDKTLIATMLWISNRKMCILVGRQPRNHHADLFAWHRRRQCWQRSWIGKKQGNLSMPSHGASRYASLPKRRLGLKQRLPQVWHALVPDLSILLPFRD